MNTDKRRLRKDSSLSLFIRGFLFSFALTFACSAEKFLSAEAAARLAFPDAALHRREVPITPEQKRRIERAASVSGVPKRQIIWIAERASNALGLVVVDQVIGKHEYIDYAVALSTNGTVLQVEILEYREHYGDQVRDSKWRAQFRGKTTESPVTLRKDIYNITGATLSCRHVTQGVKRVLATYEVVLRPELFAGR